KGSNLFSWENIQMPRSVSSVGLPLLLALNATSAQARVVPESERAQVERYAKSLAEFSTADESNFEALIDSVIERFEPTAASYGARIIKKTNWGPLSPTLRRSRAATIGTSSPMAASIVRRA